MGQVIFNVGPGSGAHVPQRPALTFLSPSGLLAPSHRPISLSPVILTLKPLLMESQPGPSQGRNKPLPPLGPPQTLSVILRPLTEVPILSQRYP